ncbi:MAG: cation transporter [Acidimicrobiia bacterium]|nr:MAG: cation transporter [Acidimicrobiia bacterium]
MGDSHHTRAAARHRGRLGWVLVLVAGFAVVEIVGGILTGSLSLLSDAGHMATDALGLGMAWAAIAAADRAEAGDHRTFGLYRLEILAALANAVLLAAVAGYVLLEAFQRLRDPAEIQTGVMIVIAGAGLAVNLVSFRLLQAGADEALTVKAAHMEVVADLAGSVGALGAGLIVRITGWSWVDALVGAGVGLFILPRAWQLGRSALRVLIQAAPDHVDPLRLRADLESLEGVVEVHDLHVWTLTSSMDVATAHIVTREGMDIHPILDRARELLDARYGIHHATLQVEPETHRGCTEVTW